MSDELKKLFYVTVFTAHLCKNYYFINHQETYLDFQKSLRDSNLMSKTLPRLNFPTGPQTQGMSWASLGRRAGRRSARKVDSQGRVHLVQG